MKRTAASTKASETQWTKKVNTLLKICRELAIDGTTILCAVIPPQMPNSTNVEGEAHMTARRNLIQDNNGNFIMPSKHDPAFVLSPSTVTNYKQKYYLFTHGNPASTVRIITGESNDETDGSRTNIKFVPAFYTVNFYDSTPQRSSSASKPPRGRTLVDPHGWPLSYFSGKNGEHGSVEIDLSEVEVPMFEHPVYMAQMGLDVGDVRDRVLAQRVDAQAWHEEAAEPGEVQACGFIHKTEDGVNGDVDANNDDDDDVDSDNDTEDSSCDEMDATETRRSRSTHSGGDASRSMSFIPVGEYLDSHDPADYANDIDDDDDYSVIEETSSNVYQ